MTLRQLAQQLGCSDLPAGDVPVTGVTEDSRRSGPGMVFFAMRGEKSDGHAFAEAAVRAGAVAVAGDRTDLHRIGGAPYLRIAHPRRALGEAAHTLAGNVGARMAVLGVTGTNGKTSTVLLTRRILETCGRPTAAFGTLGYYIGEAMLPAAHTTPFAEDLAAMFARARGEGVETVAMEVSSHSLEQERVAGIEFTAGAFTNLTQDHLDYHRTMDEYRRAKLLLFERLKGPDKFAVINTDDPSAPFFLTACRVPVFTYGAGADCQARDVRMDVHGTRFRLCSPWGSAEIFLHLLGHHNVANALCAIALAGGLGVPIEGIAAGVEALACVPGRFEHVNAGQDFQVIVDYAHTDDGLANVLKAARAMCVGRIITVFGCGGDRDRTKRPKMAAVAASMSDLPIITSDNPRTEDPEQILRDVEAGMIQAGKQRDADYWVIADRAEAIRRAIGQAKAGDLVMIAGKGHEDYQILGTTRIHFDDREVARDVLLARKG